MLFEVKPFRAKDSSKNDFSLVKRYFHFLKISIDSCKFQCKRKTVMEYFVNKFNTIQIKRTFSLLKEEGVLKRRNEINSLSFPTEKLTQKTSNQ